MQQARGITRSSMRLRQTIVIVAVVYVGHLVYTPAYEPHLEAPAPGILDSFMLRS
jgi:hypothetical protein